MSSSLIYDHNMALMTSALFTDVLDFFAKLMVPLEEGESGLKGLLFPFPISNPTLRGALAAAVESNPDVLLYKERIEASRGQVRRRLGAMLPNPLFERSADQQRPFLGSFGPSLPRSAPFRILDPRTIYSVWPG